MQTIAEIQEMADDLVARGAHRLVLVDDFPDRCALDMPLNDPDTGDMLNVAELSVEDSGFGPMLWDLALSMVKHRAAVVAGEEGEKRGPGHDALWHWFGLSRASFLTLPRAMMHDMPDEWQARMAALLNEWEDAWVNQPDITLEVRAKRRGKLVAVPERFKAYRHSPPGAFDDMRVAPDAAGGVR